MVKFFLLIGLTLVASLLSVAVVRPATEVPPEHTLGPVLATGVHYDTLLLGGYSAGNFTDAVHRLDAQLDRAERDLIGQHLERIFEPVLAESGLGRTGRLRLAVERTIRPDGSTRAIRVLGAEVAVAGRLHTAYYFERDGRPGYLDALGRPLDDGGWIGPLPEVRITSHFGARRVHPILGRILPHTGVDLAAAEGQPVRAAAAGIVAERGERGGYGLLVEIRHPDGYSTRYAHLSRIDEAVRTGNVVRQGDVIGFVGMTGLATGPHLHYEVRRRGTPIDPLRIAAELPFAPGAYSGAGWTRERRRIGELLSRAPTITRTGAGEGRL